MVISSIARGYIVPLLDRRYFDGNSSRCRWLLDWYKVLLYGSHLAPEQMVLVRSEEFRYK